jgi:hypothetical protein
LVVAKLRFPRKFPHPGGQVFTTKSRLLAEHH